MSSRGVDSHEVLPQPNVNNELVVRAKQYALIEDADTYEGAASMVTLLTTDLKEIDATFDGIIQKAHAAHKEALAQKKKHALPRETAIGVIKAGMIAYLRVEEEKRKLAEDAAREQARKDEEERLLATAVTLEADGEHELADAVLSEPVRAPAPYVPPTVPKVQGISSRETWVFRITDENLIPRQYLCVDESAIRKVVGALKQKHGIPGVEAYPVTGINVRTK